MIYLEAMCSFFVDEAKNKDVPFDLGGWDLIPGSTNTPQQNNCSDCGVFTCITRTYVS